MNDSHLVAFDSGDASLSVYRLEPSGRRVLFTKASLDQMQDMGFERFARLLGENIIMDNASLRRLFDRDP